MKKGPTDAAGLAKQLSEGRERVDIAEFAGGIVQEMATLPEIRLGRRWFKTEQLLRVLLPIGLVMLGGIVVGARVLREMPEVQAFIRNYPGTGDFALETGEGFPWWLRWQHFLNLFMMLFMMRSGLQILADHPRLYWNGDCTPGTEWLRLRGAVPEGVWTAKQDSVALPSWVGLPGIRHSIGLARWWHAALDTLWLVNGVAFFILLFATEQWRRLVPVSWSVFPHAVSTALQYASLDFPAPAGWRCYNALQMLAYFTTVFLAAPLALISGLLQAPFVAARFKTARGILNRQVARSLHFGVLIYFTVFIVTHVAMVFATGARENLNHMMRGVDDSSWGGVGVFLAAATVVGVAWILASPLTLRYPRRVQHAGRWITGWLSGAFERVRPVANFSEKDISPYFWPNGTEPHSAEFRRLEAGDFKDYRLRVGGLVKRPVDFSLAELRTMPRHEQITQHYCIQGWSGIAKWSGVPMREILRIVQPLPEARYVVFYSFAHGSAPEDGLYYDVHKIAHMEHENTILAYEMNGGPLPVLNGAPLRLRNELELGFKQVKWIQAVEFVASFAHLGSGEGGFNEDNEYFGYQAPI